MKIKTFIMKLKKMASRNMFLFALFTFLFVCNSRIHAQSKPWPVPQAALNVKNPLANNANSVKTGKSMYISLCAPCHGNKGKGDGLAAASIKPKPADHTSAAIQAESDGSLFYKISEGRSPMPQYKNAISESDRWALINYIRTLAKK